MTTDFFFMDEALAEARLALKNGEFPVGCVVTHGNRVVARGARHRSNGDVVNEIDHAEIRALHHLSRSKEGIDPTQLALYCTLEPCLMCFSAILLAGIPRVVYAYEDVMGGGTGIDRTGLSPLYRDATMSLTAGVRRAESLGLFQRFFMNPENGYLRGSFLAEYTLRQSASLG